MNYALVELVILGSSEAKRASIHITPDSHRLRTQESGQGRQCVWLRLES